MLVTLKPVEWPRENGWLDDYNSTELQRKIVARSSLDDGIMEVPPGSNRGVRIDAMTRRAGVPLGSYWCGIWVGAVYADCGVPIPEGYAAVDAWLPFMVPTPTIGSAIIYGPNRKNGTHIGIVTRLAPIKLSREGNRGYAGDNTNNGLAVDQGPILRRDILGYVPPEKLVLLGARGTARGREKSLNFLNELIATD